jgi:hypothetical protein
MLLTPALLLSMSCGKLPAEKKLTCDDQATSNPDRIGMVCSQINVETREGNVEIIYKCVRKVNVSN